MKLLITGSSGFVGSYFIDKYKNKYDIIDCQVHTEHLESLGARNISKEEFLNFLKK